MEIGVGIISMGHANFLVKVKLTWVQDMGLLLNLREDSNQHIVY